MLGFSPAIARLAAGLLLLGTLPAAAALQNGPAPLLPSAPAITFDTPGLGTTDPSYGFTVGGLPITVSFGAYFAGQSVDGAYPFSLVDTAATSPLSLASNPLVHATISTDAAALTNPILAGEPNLYGPIAILFSRPVAAVGFSAGYFDAAGSVSIIAFDAAGAVLGSLANDLAGFESFSLTAGALISGLSVYTTGQFAGFSLDDVVFSVPGLAVPAPAGLPLLLLGLGSLALLRRRLDAGSLSRR